MGLAEQRQKQRIGEDPQNTNWSKDSNRFGFKMLEKMGWTSGKGLGANEDGTLLHVKTTVKKNQHGLGFDAKTSDNWIENTSGFAQVLAKLNSITNTTTSEGENHSNETGTTKAKKEKKVKKNKKDKKDKKEKRSKEVSSGGEPEGTKKRKSSDSSSDSPTDKQSKAEPEEVTVKTKKSKKEKKDKKSSSDTEVSPAPAPAPAARLSHRARFVQNKKLSTSDPSVLSAIFGIRH